MPDSLVAPAPADLLPFPADPRFAVLDAVPEAITVHDALGNLVFANQEAAALCGFPTPAEMRAANVASWLDRFELFDRAGRPLPRSELPGRRVLAGLDAPERLIRFRHDGRERWAWVSARLLPGGDRPLAINAFREATGVVQAEQRLSDERRRMLELLEQAPVAIAVFRGPDHVYELANSRYLALVGRADSPVGLPIRRAFPEVAGQGVFEACDAVYRTGAPFVVSEVPAAFDRGRGVEPGWFAFSITPVREQEAVTGLMCVAVEITEQVRARGAVEAAARALGRSERRFRSLVEATSQMVWTTTPAGEVVEDSPSWRAFTGQSYDEWKGYGWLNAVHPDDRARAEQAWRGAVAARAKYEVEYRVRRPDGSWAHTLARGTPVLGDAGEIEEWIGLNLDITDRLEAERAARDSDRRLRLALEAGRMGTWEYDLVTGVVHWSPQIERMHGLPEGSFPGTFEAYQADLHPDDRGRVLDTIQKNVARGLEHKLLYRIVRPDGAVRWLEAVGAFVHDAGGRPVRLMGVCSDVTERVETEEARNAVRIQRMLEGIGDSFAVYDHDWKVLFANRAATASAGLQPADVIGKNLWSLAPEVVGTRMYRELLRVRETGRPATFEDYYAPLERWFEIHAYPVPEIGVAVYSRDVTARRSEQALQERLVRYGELRAEVGDALAAQGDLGEMLQACCAAIVRRLRVSFARIWILDDAGETLVLRASAGKYTHLDGGHARVPVGALKIGRIAAERRAHLTNDVLQDPWIGDPAWARREGMVAFAGYPLVAGERLVGVMAAFATEALPEDTLVGLASVGDAITQGVERRRAEIELEVRARELARSNADLEQFAYVASHDLQEPLRMVTSYVQLLERRYKDRLDDSAREFIGFAVEGVTRMRRLIEDLLAYSRVGTRGRDPAPVELAAVLATVEKNLEQAVAEAGARITKDPLPRVLADEGQLVQLFQNLIGNAIKFRRPEEPPRVHVGASQRDGEWIFSVRDNGIGIEPEYFQRIFVIFQRLNPREIYPGTGIGLAVAKKIVERHGGRIWVESTPGAGATIWFSIPVAPRGGRSV
jgi:PAS domain S-box-containing protein